MVLGPLATNCYLVWEETSRKALVIDPADDGEFIASELAAQQLIPQGILLTHGHFDHVLGALAVKLIYQVPIMASGKDEFLLNKGAQSATYWLKQKIEMPPLKIDVDLNQKEILEIGESQIHIFKIPGHTPGSIGFYWPKEKLLFSGDTLFYHSIGRTDLSYSSKDDLELSLDKILDLPSETIVLPGHGEPTTIGEEKRL